eukprot:CAMPEP_0171315632 /NCGR_PEP_ID=MMETSP0816-20121228/65905_1 /TAXON_ID=420281 /ORGANISM="Proboscia inermis, Strain CCAP1064/1" /LENGTH=56 /DNA_ID=CAMNT_0011806505 /DNA_START=80 /DNA_END=246 /DNA_ORIENTATION=+
MERRIFNPNVIFSQNKRGVKTVLKNLCRKNGKDTNLNSSGHSKYRGGHVGPKGSRP